MIAVIRGRLSSDPTAVVWPDAAFQRLLDPNVPFSLANFWRQASFGLADTTYTLFAPVTIDDPRPGMTDAQLAADHEGRTARTKAFVQAVEDQFHPDWSRFSTILIWCASPLDLWGTSAMDHGHGRCGVMTCDVASRFDQLCHELGHTLGYSHPFGAQGEYDSPYDIMGGYDSSWLRGVDPTMPMGTPGSDGVDPMRKVGPLLSAAQLSLGPAAQQLAPIIAAAGTGQSDVVLHALDAASAAWPGVLGPIAVALPPDPVSPDNHYVLELRRSRGYDAGMPSPPTPAHRGPGVVVHGYDKALKRFYFAGLLPLTSAVGDTDVHLYGGVAGVAMTLRLLEVGPDDAWARVRVGGPNTWRNFGVDLDVQQRDGDRVRSLPQEVLTRPCVFAEFGSYSFQYVTAPRTFEVTASSYGYEAPSYTWTIEGQPVPPADAGSITVEVPASPPSPHGHWEQERRSVELPYALVGAHLTLGPPVGDMVEIGKFSVYLEVRVDESSHEVVQNNYPTRTITTSLRFDNVAIDWDARYEAGIDHCESVRREVDRKRIPLPDFTPGLGRRGRPDDDLPNVLEVIESIIDRNPAAANVLIEQVGRSANIPNLEVIARLQRIRQR